MLGHGQNFLTVGGPGCSTVICNYEPLYVAYKSLEDRHKMRQAAWEFPGWDECVVKTGNEARTSRGTAPMTLVVSFVLQFLLFGTWSSGS